jgi:hypothetical protein
MKRRSFLQMLAALAGLPFLPKAAAKPHFIGQNSFAGPIVPVEQMRSAFQTAFQPQPIPVGYLLRYSGQLPEGWLPCDGRAVSRLEHNSLFDVVGTAYGNGDGLTTFALPDMNTAHVHGIRDPGHRHGSEMFGEFIIKAKP